jgi:hypothetical protein
MRYGFRGGGGCVGWVAAGGVCTHTHTRTRTHNSHSHAHAHAHARTLQPAKRVVFWGGGRRKKWKVKAGGGGGGEEEHCDMCTHVAGDTHAPFKAHTARRTCPHSAHRPRKQTYQLSVQPTLQSPPLAHCVTPWRTAPATSTHSTTTQHPPPPPPSFAVHHRM